MNYLSSDMKIPSLDNGSKPPSNSSGGENILRQNTSPDITVENKSKRNQEDKLSRALLLTAATALASISSEQRYETNDPIKSSQEQFSQDLSSRGDLYPAPPVMKKVPYSCCSYEYAEQHDDVVVPPLDDYISADAAGAEAFRHAYSQPTTQNQKSMRFPVKVSHLSLQPNICMCTL